MDAPFVREFRLAQPLFSPDSAWNQRAEGVPVCLYSDKYVETTYDIFRAAGKRSCMWILHDEYTFPIFGMKTSGEPLMRDMEMCSYKGYRWHPKTVPWYETPEKTPEKTPEEQPQKNMFARGIPLPDGSVRPSGPLGSESDGALILYNPDTGEEFDFWQATTAVDSAGVSKGGGCVGESILRAGAVSWFRTDEHAPGCQLPVVDSRSLGALARNSSRAAGTPYLAGLLVPEDFSRGRRDGIEHALTFTLPRLRHIPHACWDDPPDYVYPATCTETGNYTRERFALAAGMRIRLKETVVDQLGCEIDESENNKDLAEVTRRFFQALRTYGAYLVDGGGAFGFAAEDNRTGLLDLTDAEVADLIGESSIEMWLEKCETRWQILMYKLNEQLSWKLGSKKTCLPFATRLADGTFHSNFDVIENAVLPDVNRLREVISP